MIDILILFNVPRQIDLGLFLGVARIKKEAHLPMREHEPLLRFIQLNYSEINFASGM